MHYFPQILKSELVFSGALKGLVLMFGCSLHRGCTCLHQCATRMCAPVCRCARVQMCASVQMCARVQMCTRPNKVFIMGAQISLFFPFLTFLAKIQLESSKSKMQQLRNCGSIERGEQQEGAELVVPGGRKFAAN